MSNEWVTEWMIYLTRAKKNFQSLNLTFYIFNFPAQLRLCKPATEAEEKLRPSCEHSLRWGRKWRHTWRRHLHHKCRHTWRCPRRTPRRWTWGRTRTRFRRHRLELRYKLRWDTWGPPCLIGPSCRIVIEVDKPGGSTFLLEVDRANRIHLPLSLFKLCAINFGRSV